MDNLTPPSDLSAEDVQWMREGVRRESRKAVKRYRRDALAGFLILVIGISLVFWVARNDNAESQHAIVQSGRAVSVDGCNRDFRDRQKFRALLLKLEDVTRASAKAGRASPDQVKQAIAFYDSQLKAFSLPDCRAAANVVTNDPARTVHVPKPLTPADDHVQRAR